MRRALERLGAVRVSSIAVMSALTDSPRRAASDFSASQNSSSKDTLLAWPAILTERFFTV